MNDKCYYQYIWSTLMNSFNFRGKASRTEYAYFMLFLVSSSILFLPLCVFLFGNPSDILKGKVSSNPVSETLLTCYLLIILYTSFSSIALTFRRCRDIGHTMLVFIPCLVFVIFVVSVLAFLGATSENTEILSVLFFLSFVLLIAFPLFLLFKKGEAHIKKSENNGCHLYTGKRKNRYVILAVVTIAFLIFLFVFPTLSNLISIQKHREWL